MKNQNLQVSQTESEDSEFPPAVNKESSLFDKIKLKIFIDEYFRGTTIEEWNDWTWQIKNGITNAEKLVELLGKKKNDIIFNMPKNHLPFRITPYILYLLDSLSTDHPLYKTIIPTVNELNSTEGEKEDPLNEEKDSPVPNIVHRYPDRALFLVTNFCSTYCRYSLLPDTKILMSDFSEKNIQDIKIGDEIISDKGNVCNVYDVFSRQYDGDIIKIKTNKNSEIYTTKEHPFLSIKRNNILCNSGNQRICKPNSENCKKRHPKHQTSFIPSYNYVSELKKRDFLATPKLKNKEAIYNDIDLAYLIGLYVAEGDLPVRKNGESMGVRFSFGYSERNTIVKKLENIAINKLKYEKVYVNEYEKKSITTLRIFDIELQNFLLKNCGKYSDKKALSNDLIFNSTDNFKYYLLKGMLDGDGYYNIRKNNYNNNHSVEFNTVSKVLSNQIFMMLIMIGYKPSIYPSNEIGKIKFSKSKKVKNIIIAKKIIYRIRLTNKHDYYRFIENKILKNGSDSMSFIDNDYMFSEIKKYEEIPYSGLTWDLSVENDESYVANHLSVHNCTRTHMVSRENNVNANKIEWEKGFQYIENNPVIRDVIISGGDPLTLRDDQIEYILQRLHSIKHVEMIRIGTKVPVVLPMRITPELMNILKKYHPLYMSIHFTHPDELTEETQKACNMLADAGIPLGSQSVLLKGINDNVDTFRKLNKGLLKIRVRPYYIYQCDPIPGSLHFRTDIQTGLDIIKGLRGFTSGYAVPQYVIDAPGGGGKIPLLPNYVKEVLDDKIVLTNYLDKEYFYPL
jgi:L-lysine 2,3-aminomutase